MTDRGQKAEDRFWCGYATLFSILCLLFSVACPLQAAIDAMQLRLLEPYNQDLRWDNIESAPEWVNGVQPEYSDDWEMHRVRLTPGQQVTILLPAYESLRLTHPKQNLTAKELEVSVSNGTGLAVQQNLQQSTDGHSLVLSPQAATPLLIHIARPHSQKQAVEVALFVSRKVPIADIAPYRNLVWSTARWCLLAQEPFALPELYNQLPAWHKQRFAVTGPARLAVKNRLHYEQRANELVQDYRIRYWLDNDAVRPFRFSKPERSKEISFTTSVETSRVVTVNTAIEIVGREQQAYIEIPAGEHQLVLEADRDIYLQVLAQTEEDYLFKALNNPRLPVEDIRKQGLLPGTDLVLQAEKAKRIAQDNSRQAGGMIASNLLKTAALKRQDYPEGLTEAEQLRGFSTFYRDLLPSKKIATDAQFIAYFIAGSLHAINRPQSDAILADQHLAEALKRVGHGYFTRLPETGLANEYRLPEQQTESVVRLIVDKRDCVPRQLNIEIDQQAPQNITLRCEPEMEAEAFIRSLAETALIHLQQEDSKVRNAYLQPAPLINTAVYEISLPKSARTLKLSQTAESTTGVNIAVQYRATKTFSLSEHSYLAYRRQETEDGGQNKAWHSHTKPLSSEWLPLQRLLQTEYRSYKAVVNDRVRNTYPVNQQIITSATALAKSAQSRQQWLEALEHWAKVVNASEGLTQQQAQLAQANTLTKLGEHYLAENLRRYLSLTADVSVAQSAITQLSEQYQAQNNNAALQTLAAAMFLHRPSAAHSRLLLDALLKNGEYRFALLLGLGFVEQPPLESLLTAAYQLEWWESYHELLSLLPADKRPFWQGLKAQQQGDTAAALNAWSGASLKPWHDYLQQGLQLREQKRYAQWQQQNPGTKMWQAAPEYVKDYAGSDHYYAVERDVYSVAVRATVERPVTLGVVGPVTLNLQFRPLHPAAKPDSIIDGWLQINDNNETSRYPYTNNLPAQGLTLTGVNGLQAGNAVNLVYQVGQGWHEIQLSSEQAPLSVSIQEQRPEFALKVW